MAAFFLKPEKTREYSSPEDENPQEEKESLV